jgi:hypothetical protein
LEISNRKAALGPRFEQVSLRIRFKPVAAGSANLLDKYNRVKEKNETN